MATSVLASLAYGALGWLGKGASAAALALLALAASLAAPLAARAEPVTIAALGDSLVQGYGLPAAQGLVPQLEAWLAAQGADIVVINAGVSGDTSAGGLSRIGWTLTPEVDGLIVALGGNDLLRGIPPEVTRNNLDGILTEANTAGVPVLLVAIGAAGNYGPAYKQEFDAIFPDLAAKHDAQLHPGFFAAMGATDDPAGLSGLMQPDGIHPNARGVAKIIAGFGPEVARFAAGLDP